jgi:diguanylate cyclase (GGDEF)-like protein
MYPDACPTSERWPDRDQTLSDPEPGARERDNLAAKRDRDALARDLEADGLDIDDERFAEQAVGVQELRSTGAGSRKRAAADRELAASDRGLAALDREHAARERRQAGTDELTGARRRGVGLEELRREIDRADRTHTRLVAVFVDVDDLKSVNDMRGHRAGDELLCEVVDGLVSQMRSYDLVVRLGGDEFVCVLPDVSLEEARSRFGNLNRELQKGSISVGFSELRGGDGPRELIEKADRELLATRGERRRSSRSRH